MRSPWTAALCALLLVACVETVDNVPAVALADSWYGAIGKGHAFVAIDRFYSAEFLRQVPNWSTSLMKIECNADLFTNVGDGGCSLLPARLQGRPARGADG